jgi:hypothetical protein
MGFSYWMFLFILLTDRYVHALNEHAPVCIYMCVCVCVCIYIYMHVCTPARCSVTCVLVVLVHFAEHTGMCIFVNFVAPKGHVHTCAYTCC